MNFNELNISKPLLKALTDCGYKTPTPIQEQAIPHLLKGADLLGCAQTGTGKTCAFAVPILQRISDKKGIKALILTPTRELAAQIYDNCITYAKYTKQRSVVIFGGVKQRGQENELKKGCDVLIATPGRLNDLVSQGIITLDTIEIFVLDEADRMLDMGFIHDVKKIMRQLPAKRQTMLFSATMPPAIKKLADQLLKNPKYVSVAPVSSTTELVKQSVMFVSKNDKKKALIYLLRKPELRSVLVFTRTKHLANRVVRDLEGNGIKAMAIHGNKSQNQRTEALSKFKSNEIRVLVATDIAARGLDIDELSHVINYDLPNISETYVHRIGRTGRAGMSGTAISFCDEEERAYLKDIEKLIGKKIEVVDDDHYQQMEIKKAVKAKPQKSSKPKAAVNKPLNAKPKRVKQRASDKVEQILRQAETKSRTRY